MTAQISFADSSAGEILSWSRRTVDTALRGAVAQLPGSIGRVARYHFGWCDQAGRPLPGSGSGKSIRPALVLLSAEAVGGDPEAAVPAAVAVELVHNFTLLHDDVLDHDRLRRHRPTAWAVFGVAEAILAGDALLALALEHLARSGTASGAVAAEWLARCVVELCQGQSLDISFERRDDVEMDECLAMAAGKTGALLGCACALGGLAAGGDSRQTRLLRDLGHHLGLAFQLVDDLLGIWGDPAVTGKPAHSDLASRKKSLPVVAALTSGGTAGQDLAALFGQPGELTADELRRAAGLVERSGAREWARHRAAHEVWLAGECLTAVDCQGDVAAGVDALAHMVMSRDH